MEGFNNIQGASNRDVEGVKGGGVATAAAKAEGEVDASTIHTHTHPETFPNMSPRWEDPRKNISPVSTTVALSQLSWGDRQPAEAAAKTRRTRTDTKYLTTGTSVIPTVLMSRTATIQPHAETGRWINRRYMELFLKN